MNITKKTIASMANPYAIKSVTINGIKRIAATTEGYGPILLMSPPHWKPVEIVDGPGGFLDIAPVPGDTSKLITITESFVGYKFHTSKIKLLQAPEDPNSLWQSTELASVPFLHRTLMLTDSHNYYLIAATIAETKDSPDDWSHPGGVFLKKIDKHDFKATTNLTPVHANLYHNHGLSFDNDKQQLFISSDEGIFLIKLTDLVNQNFVLHKILGTATSEFGFIDIDNDGVEELVTIEPFHGNKLKVYKYYENKWKAITEESLAYGHGLWTGTINGTTSIILGNRNGDKNLVLFRASSNSQFSLEKTIIDKGVGAANIAVIDEYDKALVFTTNQETKTIDQYELEK